MHASIPEFTRALAESAGELIRRERLAVQGLTSAYKGGTELVTNADLQADQYICDAIRARFPGHRILAEESAPDMLDLSAWQGPLWIIDPIDGTRAFIEGRPEWCVAAALIIAGRPVLAAVYRPSSGEFYSAIAGRGAALNDQPLAIADSPSLEGARIMGNRKALAGLSHLGVAGDTSGSLPLQLRLAHVAAGRLEGAVSVGQRNDWDLAAGELLVIEAGGLVSGTSGEGYVYNRPEPWQQGLVAAGARRHAALIDALRTP